MNIKESWNDNDLIISFFGELDESCAAMVREKCDSLINKHSKYRCIFDFTNLTFMDSTGIGLILGRYKKLKLKNKVLIISNPCKQVMKIIMTSGMDRIIKIV